VADHYLAKRGVPKENVVALDLPAGEDISRDDYDRKLAGPLRDALRDRKDKVKCLLTVYGVPLRVGPKTPTDAEKAALEEVTKQIESADAAARPRLEARRMVLSHRESTAAVDSELMLLWWPAYHLARWQPNPLYWQVPEAKRKAAPPVLLTARLDGPTPEIAKRLVDDAVAAEADGLAGNAYVDARGIRFDVNTPSENGGYGYGGYDESMREAAAVLKAAGLPTTLDDKPDLFASKSCPGAAIYCGWYALANYRDCCTFARGAVAWHLASGEATTLRAGTKAWCPNLLAAGAAVTLGPVSEPYTVAFPKPAEFFGFLLTGKYTLAEVHGRTQHFASWMTVLVGDPLYNPFGKKPLVKEEDVVASPKGGRVLFK
jgi:uncharacterized protein (TIGR03790 family)